MPSANASDFFGEGVYGDQAQGDTEEERQKKRDDAALARLENDAFGYGYQGPRDVSGGATGAAVAAPSYTDPNAAKNFVPGGYGATTGYYVDPSSQAAYDTMHRQGQSVGYNSGNPLYMQPARDLRDRAADAGLDLGGGSFIPNAFVRGQTEEMIRQANADAAELAAVQGAGPVPGGGGVPSPTLPTAEGVLGAETPGAGGTGGTDGTGAPGATGGTGEGASEGVKEILTGLQGYQGQIAGLAGDNTGLSAAEAQLRKAAALANAQALLQTEQSQRAAIGAARGVRNRNDRALAERQAIGEASFIGQEAARTAELRRAEQEGNLAMLRAGEADADRRFKLDALKEAGALGLNTAALQVDINKVDMADATERMRIALGYDQLDEQHAQNLLNFAKDMASIQFQYDQLSVEDQNEADRLLMQKYQIDQDTFYKMKELKSRGELNWNQLLTTFIGGAGQASGGVIARNLVGEGTPPATGTSDERVKTNIEAVDATSRDFEEFMGALGASTYEYKEPEKYGDGLRFGFMAQDLEKTRLGKHMVKPNEYGTKSVELWPLASATASGLALVYERLQALEEAVKH